MEVIESRFKVAIKYETKVFENLETLKWVYNEFGLNVLALVNSIFFISIYLFIFISKKGT